MASVAAHLEKMGRELKCPICLELLESPVCLTCNHMFCKLCIKRTMVESVSHCPVCRVPFRRREVRSAPNMDNLISIYKSMEVDSGINTSASQSRSDEIVCGQKQIQCAADSDSPETHTTSAKGKNRKKRKINGKTSKNNDTVENQSQPSQEPSFPAKKRVHAPQCLLSETPMRSDNFAVGRGDKRSKSGPAFEPLFGLREDNPDEDVEESSGQLMSSADSEDTPQQKVPCFGDLKDSNDESPTKYPGNGEEKIESRIPVFSDSEMLQWTQKSKTKAGYKELNPIEDEECMIASSTPGATTGKAVASKTVKSVGCKQRNENTDEELGHAKATSSKNHNKTKRETNTAIAKQKCANDEVLGDDCINMGVNLGEVGEVSNQPVKFASTSTEPRNTIIFGQRLNFSTDDSVKGISVGKVVAESSKVVDPPKTSELEKTTKNQPRDTKIVGDRRLIQELREGKRVKFSTDDDSVKIKSVGKVLGETKKAAAKENQTIQCAFCQSSTKSEVSGSMLHYLNGRPVADYNSGSEVIHSHANCTVWAPNVYFKNDTAFNLESEISRSDRIKCSCCGVKGASLGCYEESCGKSFHVTCAKMLRGCRWDTVKFVMLCPLHSRGQRRNQSTPKTGENGPNKSKAWTCLGSSRKWVLCCSGLTTTEKGIVSEFTRITGAPVLKSFGPNVTHIIASTDESGACKRTLKFLMGILEGKWILNIDWIKACLKAMKPVSEKQYEVKVDIHGIKDGPLLGRLRLQKKQPKLFHGLSFYFLGEYLPSDKAHLVNLVVSAGGTVLHRKPIKGLSSTSTFIIYRLDVPENCDPCKKIMICDPRKDEAQALASSSGTNFVDYSWLLDSVAACKLQPLT